MIPNFPELLFFTTDHHPANYKINPIKNKQVDSVTCSLLNTYRKRSLEQTQDKLQTLLQTHWMEHDQKQKRPREKTRSRFAQD